jgi:hypothetical protein
MHEQLLLLRSDERPWRLDPHTREVGRRGIEEARAALRAATGDHSTDSRLARPTAA